MRDGRPGPLNISMATQEAYRNDKSRADWHKVTLWGVTADFAEKYLVVGALVHNGDALSAQAGQGGERSRAPH